MNLTELDLFSLSKTALEAAKTAAAHIRSESRGKIEVMRKEGGNTEASQVLTEVDLASERLIVEALRQTTESLDLGILTEETEDDSSRHESDYFWCIDPIDGTLPFIKGEPGYSVVIALINRAGVPQLGVVHDVVAGVAHHAIRGKGAFRNGQSVDPTLTETPQRLTWLMDRSMLKHPRYDDWENAINDLASEKGLEGVDIINHAGAALNASWLSTSAPAIYFKCPKKEDGGGSVWDFAASACFCEALGLPVSDMHGEPLNLNPKGSTFMNKRGVLYATSPEWVSEVQKIFGQLG